MAVLLAILPVAVILAVLVFWRRPADVAGLIGLTATAVLAVGYFHTGPEVVLRAALAGVVGSLPITLVVAASILQMTFMQETGAIDRLVLDLKTLAPRDRVVQILIINVGFGTLLTALGTVPVSILPPIMIALGYSSFVAIALPAIGYDALCTYALLGVPVIYFSQFSGIGDIEKAGAYFARYMPVISTCIAFGMLYIVGRFRLMWQGALPTLVAGGSAGLIAIGMNRIGLTTLTGVAAGAGVVVIMGVYLVLRRRPVRDPGVLTEAERAARGRMSLWLALSPWLILVATSVAANAPVLPLRHLLFDVLDLPVTVLPGQPIKTRFFYHAYFWILVSTVLAVPLLRPDRAQRAATLRKWLKRAPRPSAAAAVFFAIAYVLDHSGKQIAAGQLVLPDPDWNMINVLAAGSARLFGALYPLVAPFLGLLAGFISGSETSAIAMLTRYHLQTAAQVGLAGLVVAAASGIGGGLASVISPAKLQNAAASIDRIGEESGVIRTTVVIAAVITGVAALMTLYWA